MRIARRQQLGPRTTLPVGVVRDLCRVLGIVYTAGERRDALMPRVAQVLRHEMCERDARESEESGGEGSGTGG